MPTNIITCDGCKRSKYPNQGHDCGPLGWLCTECQKRGLAWIQQKKAERAKNAAWQAGEGWVK